MATTVSLKPNAVEISGSTSGTTTLQATAVAGTTTLTLPAATDTLVGKATTDTLTNKTLTGAVMNGTLGATTPSTVAATTLTTSSTVTHNGGTANGVGYLDGSKVLTTGSALVFDGTNFSTTGSATVKNLFFTGGTLPGAANPSIALRSSDNIIYHQSGSANSITFLDSAQNAMYVATATQHTWNISNAEKARIDSSGNLLVGRTTTANTTVGSGLYADGVIASCQSASTNANTAYDLYSTGAAAYRFYVGMGGTIFATTTVISAISDARFKENIRDLDAGLAEVMALKPRLYDWKEGKGADIKNTRGFIAQEFEEVFPDLIDEWKDPAPEGEEPYKSVRQDLIPVLVKAIQEQQVLITQLQADVALLKSAQ